jgi:hypothetical protein
MSVLFFIETRNNNAGMKWLPIKRVAVRALYEIGEY